MLVAVDVLRLLDSLLFCLFSLGFLLIVALIGVDGYFAFGVGFELCGCFIMLVWSLA